MDEIRSLPKVKKTYTELMNDIKFQTMDKKQKTEFLLKTTGQKFYEAKERGDKEAMKEYLKQGIGLTFAYMDDKAGITDIKGAAKKYSGLNTVVDAIDKFVDEFFTFILDIIIYGKTKNISLTKFPIVAKDMLDDLREDDFIVAAILMNKMLELQYNGKNSPILKELFLATLLGATN